MPRVPVLSYSLDSQLLAVDITHKRKGQTNLRAHAVAGPVSRMMAGLFDHALPGIPTLLIAMNFAQSRPSQEGALLALVAGIFVVVVTAIVSIVFETRESGATLGKHLFGLRVVAADGSSPQRMQIVLRNVLRLVDVLPIFYGLGLMATFRFPGQRLGDVWAGTMVVRALPVVEELEILGVPASAYGTSEPGYLLEAWVLRHPTLPEANQKRLAYRLATYLHATYPPECAVLLNLYRLQEYVEFLRRLHAEQIEISAAAKNEESHGSQ